MRSLLWSHPYVRTAPEKQVERARTRAFGHDNGHEEKDLPQVNLSEIPVTYARKSVIAVHGFLYDVGEFVSGHPGGAALLKRGYGGKDLSGPFEELNRHTLQARDLMIDMRIAQIIS